MHVLDSVWETVKREFDAARQQSADAVRTELLRDLNQVLRRLQRHESEAEWTAAVLDGTSRFARQVAVFEVLKTKLVLRGQRGLDLASDLEISVEAGPALKSALTAKDTVVALRTPSEVSEALASEQRNHRAYITPVTIGARVAALLFISSDEPVDVNAIELMAGIASTVLEQKVNSSLQTEILPVAPALVADGKKEEKARMPSWCDLKEAERRLHGRAQRFARTKVAEMQLYKPTVCQTGREQENIYVLLRSEIESAREAYNRQFMTIPSMVDYLHLELVRAVAEGDELKLGAEYPGQLL